MGHSVWRRQVGAGPAEDHREATLTDGVPVAPGDGVGAQAARALPGP